MQVPSSLSELPVEKGPPSRRWTRTEYEGLLETIAGQERLELVEGELLGKMGKSRPYATAVLLLHTWLIGVFGPRFVQQEAPIDVAPEDNPTSEPQPDLIVTKEDGVQFWDRNPRPQDLLLVIEVGDTTLGFDLTVKAGLYARAGIAEYWVADIPNRRLIVHREVDAGAYRTVAAYAQEETLAPLASPRAVLRVGEIFAW